MFHWRLVRLMCLTEMDIPTENHVLDIKCLWYCQCTRNLHVIRKEEVVDLTIQGDGPDE